MGEEHINTRINRGLLLATAISTVIAALSLSGSPLFTHFFQGKLLESNYSSAYQETHKGKPYYVTKFDFQHMGGNSIDRTTIEIRVENSAALIDAYEPYFKTLYKAKEVVQTRDAKFIKLDVPEIRPKEEFSVILYSKIRGNFRSNVVMANGRKSGRDDYLYNSPVLWVLILIFGYFVLFHLYYRRIIKGLEREKERVIGERNALQSIILSGERLSASRRSRR